MLDHGSCVHVWVERVNRYRSNGSTLVLPSPKLRFELVFESCKNKVWHDFSRELFFGHTSDLKTWSSQQLQTDKQLNYPSFTEFVPNIPSAKNNYSSELLLIHCPCRYHHRLPTIKSDDEKTNIDHHRETKRWWRLVRSEERSR